MYKEYLTDEFSFDVDNYFLSNHQYLEKRFIYTHLYHPIFKKLLFYKFNFCTIKYIGKRDISKTCLDGSFVFSSNPQDKNVPPPFADSSDKSFHRRINKQIIEEIKKYCPDTKKNKSYFFCETFYRGKKMPDYYGFLYTSDDYSFSNNSINKDNYQKFLNEIKECFGQRVKNRLFLPNADHQYFMTRQHFGEILNEYLYNSMNNKQDYKLDIEFFRIWQDRISSIDDEIVKKYISIIVKDFIINEIITRKDGLICQHCGYLMAYAETKKYCSLNTDGQDCGKKARNARAYQVVQSKK